MTSTTDFGIVGAGLVGCAAALALHKRGFNVEVWESRSDPRSAQAGGDVGRSINLALSARGLAALDSIDPSIGRNLSPYFVPMRGRMVHAIDGKLTSVPYGITGTEAIQSIGRSLLNAQLLGEVEKAGIPVHFNAKLGNIKFVDGGATFTVAPSRSSNDSSDSTDPSDGHTSGSTEVVRVRTLVGCDGTWSRVRQAVQRHEDSRLSVETVDTYYVEMSIGQGSDLDPNHLHIWPRQQFMFIALPNADGSFTGTLFAPRDLLQSLSTFSAFSAWFKAQFPDAAVLVGKHLRSYFEGPRGRLVNIKAWPYNHDARAVFIGDAAHSMVPFYGQGLNAGLEDVRVLMDHLDRYPTRLTAFNAYSAARAPDLDAINDLSMRNYIEMRDAVATRSFLLRKNLDRILARLLGDRWLPLYTMVSFRSDVRYSEAVREDSRQSKLLDSALHTALWGAVVAGIALWGRRH